MKYSPFVSLLGALAAILSSWASPTEASQDAISILEASNRAMAEVHSFRLSGNVNFAMTRRGMNISMAVPLEMEFQAPDRMHASVDASMMGISGEVIFMTNRLWMLSEGGVWEETDLASLGLGEISARPQSSDRIASLNAGEVARYVKDLTVNREGANYRVSADFALDEVLTDRAMGAMITGSTRGAPDFGGARGHMDALINAATQRVDSIELVISTLAPDTVRGQVDIHLALTFSDYNNTDISITPPPGF